MNPSEVGSKMEGVPIKDTMLSDMCPDIESAFCFPHKYRTINGECNNVKNPTWGITGAAYLRILQPMYQDGESLNRKNGILFLVVVYILFHLLGLLPILAQSNWQRRFAASVDNSDIFCYSQICIV